MPNKPNSTDGLVVNFIKKLFNVPIEPTGSNVKVTKKGEDYRFNGRKPSNGYIYYDRGNTYKFINGKRTLYNQSSKARKESQEQAKLMSKKVAFNTKIDEEIANKKGYGIINNKIQGWDVDRLKKTINPNARLGDPFSYAQEGWNYMWNDPLSSRLNDDGTSSYTPNPESEAFWYRHLGFDRNFDKMPINGIRFTGDYNPDGSLKFPNAEYTGISTNAKDAIRKLISSKVVKVPVNGSWVARKESRRDDVLPLEQLGNFAIRENNESGIYDIFDTYDFDSKKLFGAPWLNKSHGKQIEVRDTVWGKHAIPELYNINFSSKKK